MTATTQVGDRDRVLNLVWGFFPAQVVQTLARLGVPDALGTRARAVDELAVELSLQPDALYRLLRAACAIGLTTRDDATCNDEDRWRLTADGDLLRSGLPGSVGNLAQLFCGGEVWRAWGELEYSVRTGTPSFERITGRGAFEHMAQDPVLGPIFTEAMAEGSRSAAGPVVAACDLTGVTSVVDVGGGNGTLLARFLDEHPALQATLFDSPSGVGDAATVLGGRAEVVTGDFFVSVPTADAHVLKSVIHDWDDERSLAIMRTIRAAMPEHGTLFLVEPLLPADDAALAAMPVLLMSDLNMMVNTGGKERTLEEFTDLLAAAGLRLLDVTKAEPTGYVVMRAVPAP
ncbi:acetylserotonin O-methyltransferase [Pseudonocardia sp. TRM90224]|uniref:acetylserotonin O-methyltransferase n=1 Tax=Pseudonocardia sp. TRM90224 TaxID=2812678 RepID=UPI001E498DE3|nr:acetylserotonin O-methyltransferase [Pseudonocardia sp. TRM90224]